MSSRQKKERVDRKSLSCLVGWELSSWVWGGRVSVHYLRLTSTCHTRHNLIHPPFCQNHIMILKELRGKKTRTIVGRFITLAPVTIPFLLEHQSSVLGSNAPTVLGFKGNLRALQKFHVCLYQGKLANELEGAFMTRNSCPYLLANWQMKTASCKCFHVHICCKIEHLPSSELGKWR